MSSLPLVEGAAGLTSIITWTVNIREDWEFLEKALAKEALDESRVIELLITLEHEAVHFLQGLTTAFTLSASVNFLNLFIRVQRLAKAGELSSPNLLALRQTYDNFWAQFRREQNGISPIHLLESMAVTESYRATAATPSPEGLQKFIDKYFPDKRGVYRKVINVVGAQFGTDAALNLTPRLCFLALNGDDPGLNFWDFVERLKSSKGVAQLTVRKLCDLFGMNSDALLLLNYDTMPKEMSHPFLRPYIDLLKKVPRKKEDSLLESVAMPGARAKCDDLKDLFDRLLPAYVAVSGGRAEILGLAHEWPKEQVMAYMAAVGILGASERMLSTGRPYQSCVHTACPIYRTALCHTHYPPSARLPWADCSFPSLLSERFGVSCEQLFDMRSKAGILD